MQHATYLKSFDGDDNTYAWWASIYNLRLSNALLDLDAPIFVGQGTEDLAAPLISAHKLRDDFAITKKTNLHYVEYNGYDHGFTDLAGKSHLIEVFSEAIKWILNAK